MRLSKVKSYPPVKPITPALSQLPPSTISPPALGVTTLR